MKGKALLCLALVASMLFGVFTTSPVSAQSTTIGVEPDSIVDPGLGPGSTFTVEIWVRDVANLAGLEFKLGYDTTVLTATLIEYGGIFGATYFPLVSVIYDADGYLHYAVMQALGEGGVGDGRAAIIHFTVDSWGASVLDLYDTILGDTSAPPLPIVHDVLDGFFSNVTVHDHDIAIIRVVPSPTRVAVGDSVTISVTVENEGNFDETFDVTAYCDNTPIETKIDIFLESEHSTTLIFTWDTTGFAEGTYIMSAEVPPVPDEADTADNLFIDGQVTVWVLPEEVTWTETIYIRADGSVDPTTAPISSADNITYTLTDNIIGDVPERTSAIVVERDNVMVDGTSYTLQGTGASDSIGIALTARSNVTIKNIEIKAFTIGIWVSGLNNTISVNNITNNNWGIWVSGLNNTISGNSITNSDYGIQLIGSNYNTISVNTITNNWHSISLLDSNYNTISVNTITNNIWGIWVGGSNYNTISVNNITENNEDGIELVYSSNNTISVNTITNNRYGINLDFFSNYNTVSVNTITNNWHGIWLYFSSNNSIYHNNFMDNNIQVHSEGSTNIWDDGYPSGGNYWSDYTIRYPDAQELDDSGTWNTPYVIDENNQDNYPLMEPWSPKPPSPKEALEELIETIETWDLPKGTENSLTSQLEGTLHLLDIENENGATHKLMNFINQVEAQRDKKLTDEQADYLTSEAQRIINLIEG